eukprot:768188-Hanusia_phi.AAC.3
MCGLYELLARQTGCLGWWGGFKFGRKGYKGGGSGVGWVPIVKARGWFNKYIILPEDATQDMSSVMGRRSSGTQK